MNRHALNLPCFASTILVVLLATLNQCGTKETKALVSFQWSEGRATGLIISAPILADVPADSLPVWLDVRWEDSEPGLSMLGRFTEEGDGILFTPIVPFTYGLRYEVIFRDSVIARLELPPADLATTPAITGIYPSSDTVPENLLKIFIRFSQPMVEGRSLSRVIVLRGQDTVNGTFLDLQPELWNEDGTLLTLWLDPGRIKRDLIPNKQLGNPLVKGQRYSIHILPGWRSKAGLRAPSFVKNFFVTSRDEQSPAPARWKLKIPKSGTNGALGISFGESLDYSMISTGISIVDSRSIPVPGRFVASDKERGINFIPEQMWLKSSYVLRVEPRVEDLAGNNLYRLFDADITKSRETNAEAAYEARIEIVD